MDLQTERGVLSTPLDRNIAGVAGAYLLVLFAVNVVFGGMFLLSISAMALANFYRQGRSTRYIYR